MDAVLDLIKAMGAIIGSLATVVLAVWGAQKVRTKADHADTASPALSVPYETVVSRLISLEEADREKGRHIWRLTLEVRSLSQAMLVEVRSVVDWVKSGANPPPPERALRRLENLIEDLEGEEDSP